MAHNELLDRFRDDARSVAEKLNATRFVSWYFKECPPDGHLHLLVQVPISGYDGTATPASARDEREDIANAAKLRGPPSDAAKASQQAKLQDPATPHAVYNWRTHGLRPPPLAPYFPAFATFHRELSAVDEGPPVKPEELRSAMDLIILSTNFYSSEDARLDTVLETALFSYEPTRYIKKGQPALANRLMFPDVHCTCACPPIPHGVHPEFTEVMHEIGLGGSDPITQAECDYVSVYTSDLARPLRSISCCPALLIAIAGPYITFAAAIFAHVLISQRLTGYIFLAPYANENEDDAARRVARMIRALNKLRAALDEYYKTLKPQNDEVKPLPKRRKLLEGTESVSPNLPRVMGPMFSTFSKGGTEYKLEYLKRLDPDPGGGNKGKAVFSALAVPVGSDKGDHVVVKFARKYGKQGHALLAEQSPPFAPKLWYCEPIKELGGLWMIVMDYVHSYGELNENRKDQVKAAIHILHAEGLVFGDLRLPNVLALGDGVMLIDFDWCGKAGEAEYPASINTEIMWPPGVFAGAKLLPSHDDFMLGILTATDR